MNTETLTPLKEAIDLVMNIRDEHWAIELALEYLEQAYQEIRDVGIG